MDCCGVIAYCRGTPCSRERFFVGTKYPAEKIRGTAGVVRELCGLGPESAGLEALQPVLPERMMPGRICAIALAVWGGALAGLAPDPRIWFDMVERKGPGERWKLDSGDWDRWDRFFHRKIMYSDWKSQADRVTAIGRESNDYSRLLDWEPRPLALTWWFDSSGRISGFMFHAVRDAPTHSRLKEFEAWAGKNRPQEIAYLKPGGAIDPSKDRPERWLAILIEWRKAAGLPDVALPPPAPAR